MSSAKIFLSNPLWKGPGICKSPSQGGDFQIAVPFLIVLACAFSLLGAYPSAHAQESAFPEELTGIQMQYLRSLEPVMEEQRTQLSKLRNEYYQELLALGKRYVRDQNQSAALAVKVEIEKLKAQSKPMPAPSIEPPQDLVDIRERFEEQKFNIEDKERRGLRELAQKYIERLGVWSKLYRDKGKSDSAQAVDAEIRRIEASLKGEVIASAPPAVVVKPVPGAAAPGAESVDPLDNALSAVEEGAAEASPAPPDPSASEDAPPQLPKPPEGLTLKEGWQGTAAKDRALADELTGLLGAYGTPRVNLNTFPGLVLYGKVRYLMPWEEARKALELDAQIPQTGVIETPGWPGAGSLRYYRFKGKFDKQYTALNVIVDAADHVVIIQLTATALDTNLGFIKYRPVLPEWKYYDYLSGGKKSTEAECVWHVLFARNLMGEFTEETENIINANAPCMRLDTVYIDPTLKVQFLSRTYLVKPFLDTLLYSCSETQ